jgi:membrane protease YdiL (CAAX protease family)
LPTTPKSGRQTLDRGAWAFLAWVGLAAASLPLVTTALDGSVPVFTAIWLVGPVIAVRRSRSTAVVGVQLVALGTALRSFGVCMGLVAALMVVFEPWSHTYEALIRLVLDAPQPDTTFAWLKRFDGPCAWLGLALYSGLVTLFAEELCFRGWLLIALRPRFGYWGAIVAQASLFTLPNLIAAAMLPMPQGALYAGVYAWLAIGMVGGWAAERTGAIWPSLATATIVNLALTALVR